MHKNTISQIIVLINRIKKIVYRGTEKKTLIFNAIFKLKLDNFVRIYGFINSLSSVRSLYLNKTLFRESNDVTAGVKIEIKTKLKYKFSLNSYAYRIERDFLTFR